MNRICDLETARALFRQQEAILAEKRKVNVAPSGMSVRSRRNRQRRPINFGTANAENCNMRVIQDRSTFSIEWISR